MAVAAHVGEQSDGSQPVAERVGIASGAACEPATGRDIVW